MTNICGDLIFDGFEPLPCASRGHDEYDLALPSDLDTEFGTPYPRSAGFDTDIGAFIESSSVSLLHGLMAPSIINDNAVQGESFLP